MLTALREIVRYRNLLRDLVARDLKVRYKRSVLGVAWTMLNPLLMMAVFTIVFSEILRVPVKNFAVYFLSAFLLWNFVARRRRGRPAAFSATRRSSRRSTCRRRSSSWPPSWPAWVTCSSRS